MKIDDEIRRHVEKMVAQHYPGLQVRVANARIIEGRGIEIRGFRISEPRDGEDPAPLIAIDELLLVCQPTIPALLNRQLEVENILVRRPSLRTSRRDDGSWSTDQLFPLPKFSDCSPDIIVEDGRLELIHWPNPAAAPAVFRNIDLRMATKAVGRPDAPRKSISFQGSLQGEYVDRIDLSGAIDVDRSTWHLAGTAHKVRACPELCQSLPSKLPEPWNRATNINALATIQFDLQGTGFDSDNLQIETHCKFTKGSFADPILPAPLTDLTAQVRFQDDSLVVEKLTGRMGKTRLELALHREELSQGGPLRLTGNIKRLRLDEDLFRCLPSSVQTVWNKFLPAGEVDLDLELVYEGGVWRPNAVVQCRNLDFTYEKFPYRLEHGQGTISLRDKKLSIDLTTEGGSRGVRVRAELQNPGPRALGWVEIVGSDLPVSARLLEALPEKARRPIEALHPSGKFQLLWRSWRDDPNVRKMHAHMLLSVSEGAIRFQRFPYPLANIRGTVEMLDDRWTFRDLEGTNDSGFVTCKGEMVRVPDGNELTLHFAGTDIQLEEELRDALSKRGQKLWGALRPRGRIDLASDVKYRSSDRSLDLQVRIEPLGKTASIEPIAFPYRMDKIQGVVSYDNGKVQLNGIRAEHGYTRLATQGTAQTKPDGGWYLHLDGLSVDRMRADHDLLFALPTDLSHAIGRLNPTGPINMRGSLGLSRGPLAHSPLRSRWDLAFDVHRGTLDCGVKLENVHGGVRLAGSFDGKRFQSTGDLSIDSLTYQDIQFTQILGPLWIDDNQVRLGVWAEQKQGRHKNPRRVTGRLYGGQLVGDGWVTLEKTPRFGINAALSGGDLQRFARESLRGQQQLRGDVLAHVQVTGNGSGLHSLVGSGNIQLRNADIYELPISIALLKVLQARLPDTTAFNASNMKFRIAGPHLYFDQLDLLGDALSLQGKGEMDLQRRIKFTFHTNVGPTGFAIPFWRGLVGQASQQIMEINVNGTLDEPNITNQAFPRVNEAIQQLQADLQAPIQSSAR